MKRYSGGRAEEKRNSAAEIEDYPEKKRKSGGRAEEKENLYRRTGRLSGIKVKHWRTPQQHLYQETILTTLKILILP